FAAAVHTLDCAGAQRVLHSCPTRRSSDLEMLNLEGAQAGLSWYTVLTKRENYRRAFDNWDAKKIARYTDKKIEKLLQDPGIIRRSEEHTSELQSRENLVCRLLLEKKKTEN